MLSFLPLKRLNIQVRSDGTIGDCLALERLSVSGIGAEMVAVPASFARFALEANLGEATGWQGTWEDAIGKALAVSVLVHSGGKVLVFKRKDDLAVQSGRCTATVTGTVNPEDINRDNILVAAALRELREEAGLSEADGTLAFRGLVLAPGKAQPVGLFEFACTKPPEDVLSHVLAWPGFHREHEEAKFLKPEQTLVLPLSPVSKLAVELFKGGPPPNANYTATEREKEALRRLAIIDPLTGLLNSSGFRTKLEKVLVSCRHTAVVVFDVDGLKLVNDRYGHQAGDELLLLFAAVLSSIARKWPDAAAARLGGDEFAVLLPETNRTGAEEFAKLVLDEPRLETSPASRLSSSGSVCAGWGVAVYPEDATDIEGLLAVADTRLREAKARRKSFALAFSTVLARFGNALSFDEAEAIFEAVLTLAGKVDPYLKAHCEQVGLIAEMLAEKAGFSYDLVRMARLAGRFHDIGKVGVSSAILCKEGPLTPDERILVRRHPVIGAEMLRTILAMAPVADAVLYHHERWDGKGYPDGLKGEEIPLLARVIALADAWGAMTAERPYRNVLSSSEALERIVKAAGSQFDPVLVEVFASLFKNGKTP